MGDRRYERHYARVRNAKDRARVIRDLSDEGVLQALAAASRENDPLLANVLATEALNRMRRVKEVVGQLAEAVLAVDGEERIMFANEAATLLLGRPREDLVGCRMPECCPLLDVDGRPLPPERWPLPQVRNAGALREGDVLVVRSDGTTFVCSYRASPILQDTAVAGAVVSLRDVTEMRRGEVRARAQEQRLMRILEYAPDVVCVVDPRGVFQFVSAAALEVLGYAPGELQGRSWRELLSPDEAQRLEEEEWPRAMATPGVVRLRFHARRKDGTRAPVEATVLPIEDRRTGDVIEMVAIMRTLSDA